jgi:hypothetical protein
VQTLDLKQRQTDCPAAGTDDTRLPPIYKRLVQQRQPPARTVRASEQDTSVWHSNISATDINKPFKCNDTWK